MITRKNMPEIGKALKELKHDSYSSLQARRHRIGWKTEEIHEPERYAAISMLMTLAGHKHTLKCLLRERRNANMLARFIWYVQAFTAMWPKYCRECDASGRTYDPGYWDARAGVGLPDSEDYCEHCIGKGNCPRCGANVFNEDMGDEELSLCPSCGWTPKSETIPESSGTEFYCDCATE